MRVAAARLPTRFVTECLRLVYNGIPLLLGCTRRRSANFGAELTHGQGASRRRLQHSLQELCVSAP